MGLHEVALNSLPLARFVPLVGEARVAEALADAARVRAFLRDSVLWNVNSTGFGGGVAEMLGPLLSYARGAGIDARWVVIEGPPDFFRITKRLHNALHGEVGDRTPLGASERALYEEVSRVNAGQLLLQVRAGDVVLLHDPQTAGLAPYLVKARARVVWRCHVGRDSPNAEVDAAWRFLLPYLADVPLAIFSRRSYVPVGFASGRSVVVAPSIDPFSAKNAPIPEADVHAILRAAGLVVGGLPGAAEYLRSDGSRARVERSAEVLSQGPPPDASAPLVVQVSRWDHLKDPVGVMLGFAGLLEAGTDVGAQLVLAGPNVNAVADDPDGARVFADVVTRFHALPHEVRRRVHLAMLPTRDADENAALVNALQRQAAIVVQKSLHEGFGLTVTEAMWKRRAVVASAVGGIQDQITDGRDGVLLADPADLPAFTGALGRLLADARLRERLGVAAHETVRTRFLAIRHLRQYAEILDRLAGQGGEARGGERRAPGDRPEAAAPEP